MFKKGDKVYAITSWNDKGTFMYCPLVIQSWGKVQGTAVTDDGSFTKVRLYADCAGRTIFSSEIDPIAVGTRLATEYIEQETQRLQRIIDSNNTAYHLPSIQEKIDTLKNAKPTVIAKDRIYC